MREHIKPYKHIGHADMSRLTTGPTLPRRENPNQIEYVPGESVRMKCNRILAIAAKPVNSDTRPHIVGYVAWRKRDNHKVLFVRAENGRITLVDKLPQTKKTSIPMLAWIMGYGPDVVLTLKNSTGYDGGRPVGGPVFRTTSYAGGFREL